MALQDIEVHFENIARADGDHGRTHDGGQEIVPVGWRCRRRRQHASHHETAQDDRKRKRDPNVGRVADGDYDFERHECDRRRRWQRQC